MRKSILNSSIYWIPILLLVVLSVTHYFNFIDKDFSINLITEVIGILITVLLIERISKKAIQAERKRTNKIALKKLYKHLRYHFSILQKMYEASSLKERRFRSYDDFLSDDFYKTVENIDLLKEAPVFPKQNWSCYVEQHLTSLNNEIHKFIDIYITVLDNELLEILEDISDETLTVFFRHARPLRNQQNSQKFLCVITESGTEFCPIFKDHVNLFKELCKYYSKNYSKDSFLIRDNDMWQQHVAPKMGTARI